MNQYLVLATHIVVVTALLVLAFRIANRRLIRYYDSRPHQRYRQQLYQIIGLLLGILLFILLMPFDEDMRGQLLNLYGLVLTATIALSSTTLVGNVMAGITLKVIGNCRPGDYITVGDHFGRITEMDLIHTEIQTEERDLTTLPNMYLVTNPVRVMRASGTVLAVELSLGYDVSRRKVEELLIGAAQDTGLESPFVQIRNLGDYSVTYRICGLLKEINRLLDKRRELRGRTIDALHSESVEIVSPTFMNTRAFDPKDRFVSDVSVDIIGDEKRGAVPDSIVFDKAERAQSVEKLREQLADAETRLKECEQIVSAPENDAAAETAAAEKQELEVRIDRLRSIIDRKEAKISGSE